MDRREAMALSGSPTYYMPRMDGTGSTMQGSPSIHPLANPNMSYQSNMGGNSMGSTYPVEPSPVVSSHGVNVGPPPGPAEHIAQPVKRKRGRPRKYGHDGSVSLALSPTTSTTPPAMITPTQKRGRGRPPGTGRKQQLASLGEWLSGSAGMGFTPHVIAVAVGEDITTKIMSFSQQGRRAICILSASGSVSTVTLRQPANAGATVRFEGRFEILCLSGSYLLTDSGDPHGRSGGISVSLSSPDGRVIGGGVGGVLIAATPVQVIVGSFIWGNPKTKSKNAGAVAEGAGDRNITDNPVPQGSVVPPSQNFSPNSSIGGWHGSQPTDMQNVHMDIDLMRG